MNEDFFVDLYVQGKKHCEANVMRSHRAGGPGAVG